MDKALAGLCLLLVTGSAQAIGLDLTLSDESASLAVLLNPYEFYSQGSELAVGAFISEGDDQLLFASLMAKGTRISSNGAYRLGTGIKFIQGDIDAPPDRPAGADDSEGVGALALGFQVVWISPGQHSVPTGEGNRRSPWEFGFDLYYAPKIASFSDAENYLEMSARLQIEIIPTARAYIGYRRIKIDTNDYTDLELDDAVHFGLLVYFQ